MSIKDRNRHGSKPAKKVKNRQTHPDGGQTDSRQYEGEAGAGGRGQEAKSERCKARVMQPDDQTRAEWR